MAEKNNSTNRSRRTILAALICDACGKNCTRRWITEARQLHLQTPPPLSQMSWTAWVSVYANMFNLSLFLYTTPLCLKDDRNCVCGEESYSYLLEQLLSHCFNLHSYEVPGEQNPNIPSSLVPLHSDITDLWIVPPLPPTLLWGI